MLNDFNFALHITAPIFCILGLGIIFKRIGLVTEEFARIGSALVFKVTLPCLLFVKLVKTDFRHGLPLELIAYAATSCCSTGLSRKRSRKRTTAGCSSRGPFAATWGSSAWPTA